jgi:hypothetical protein
MYRFLLGAFLAAQAGTAPPGWEKVHTVESSGGELAAILAWDDERWVAAGGDVIVHGGPHGIQSVSEPGKFIVGLGGGGKEPLLAVGSDDLILRWDGKTWAQDSFAADAAKLSRMRRRQLLLQGALYPSGELPLAFGPWRVLARQVDGRWQAPSEKERYRLMMLAQMGPTAFRPKGCNLLQWRWLAGGDGWMTCQDRRTFVITKEGRSIDGGRLPKRCGDTLGTVAQRGETVFAACGEGEVWRSGNARWERVPSPNVDAIAVGGRCLFGVSRKTVWRNCSVP